MRKYLNNAGAGIMSSETFETIFKYLKLEMEIGAYHAATINKESVQEFYRNAAKLINVQDPDEIAFVDSSSRGWNLVVHGLTLNKGDRILTLSSEFGTNLITLFDKARQIHGEVSIIDCDETGTFSLEEFEKELKNGIKLIAISHAAAHGSIVNPVEEIGKLAKKYGTTYIVDGCQSVGQLEVNVNSIGCDAYVTTGRKWLCGPRGTGFLYVKRGTLFRSPQLDLSSADLILDKDYKVTGIEIRNDARQFELWERSVSNMLGLSVAMQRCIEYDINKISGTIQLFSNKIRHAVLSNDKLRLLGSAKSRSGITGFYVKKPELESLLIDRFEENQISISTMSNWDCPLHFPKNGATKIFRLSPHYFSDISIIEDACFIIENF